MKSLNLLAAAIGLILSFPNSHAADLVTDGSSVGGSTVIVNLANHASGSSVATSINASGNLVFAPRASATSSDYHITFNGLGLDTSVIRYVQIDFLTTSSGAVTGGSELFHTDTDSSIGGANNSSQSIGQPAVNAEGPFSIVVDLVAGSPSGAGIGWGPGTANTVRFDLFQVPANRGETFEISGITFGTSLIPAPVPIYGQSLVYRSWIPAGDKLQDEIPRAYSVPIYDGIHAIDGGDDHSLAIDSAGGVVFWGSWNGGTYPEVIEEAKSGIIDVAAGHNFSLALKEYGEVIAWGQNGYNQITVPLRAKFGVTAIDASIYYSMALKNPGEVLIWGFKPGYANVPEAAKTEVIGIAAAFDHALALKSNGSVVAWGSDTNAYGYLNIPTEATGGVTSISTKGYHNLALKSNGSVIAWGDNSSGQCDVPTEAMSGVVAISAGAFHSVALKDDGTILAWGAGGPGTSTSSASPDHGQSDIPDEASTGIVKISAGEYYTLAVDENGIVHSWGNNPNLRINLDRAASPDFEKMVFGGTTFYAGIRSDGSVAVWLDPKWTGLQTLLDIPVEASSGVVDLVAGTNYLVALKDDGTVVTWGGIAATPVGAQSGVSRIASTDGHCLALTETGEVVAWGNNSNLQCNVPAAATSGVSRIAAGVFHSVAVKAGEVLSWGNMFDVPDSAKTDVVDVVAGRNFSAAMKSNGQLVVWRMWAGALEELTLPAEFAIGVSKIVAQESHLLAVLADGSVANWQVGYPSVHLSNRGLLFDHRAVDIASGGSRCFVRVLGKFYRNEGFLAALNDAGLTDESAFQDASPFRDGSSNILKYSCNMDLSAPDVSTLQESGTSGLPAVELVEENGQPALSVKFVRRIGSDLLYIPEVSANLKEGSWVPMDGEPLVEGIDETLERVTVTEPIGTEDPSMFGRVRIIVR